MHAGILLVYTRDPNYVWLLSLAAGGQTPPSGETSVTVDVSDVTGSPDFLFDTTRTIPVFITVRDPVPQGSGTLVQILDSSSAQELLFQATSNAQGSVEGTFTVNQTTKLVTLRVTIGTDVHTWTINITDVQEIRRFLFVTGEVNMTLVADADSDGVPDSQDAYPLDATRSAIIRVPAQGFYTVAFEDLYPVQGDADFNDYVAEVRYEQDLDASGRVARMRGFVRHIARGAGYRHTLRLTLPTTSSSFHSKLFAANGSLELENETALTSFEGIEVMPNSGTTISSANSAAGEVYAPGKSSEFEVIPATPMALASLGNAPYDLHLHVVNTGYDIHFLGRYLDANGHDQYLDPSGFPWAIMIPGNWSWPLERVNMHTAYPKFQEWYQSAGQAQTDWYLTPAAGKVFSK